MSNEIIKNEPGPNESVLDLIYLDKPANDGNIYRYYLDWYNEKLNENNK